MTPDSLQIPHWFYIVFLFLLGSCIGSFLNVVVWRLPRGKSLFWPPSACPKCGHALAWYDNLPVIGWIMLAGKCRYCREPVSSRYPIIEAVTGLLMVLYYWLYFMVGTGPSVQAYDIDGVLASTTTFTDLAQDWPYYGLYMILICGLLAASLIDAEMYIIPVEIPWVLGVIGVTVHAVWDRPGMPGALSIGPVGGAIAAGAGVGVLLCISLWRLGILPQSFPKGEPFLESEREELLAEMKKTGKPAEEIANVPPAYTKGGIRLEIVKEAPFLLVPIVGAILSVYLIHRFPSLGGRWNGIMTRDWAGGLLGSVLGGLVAAFCIWATRVCGTLGFGRIAMGQGDTHLMLAIGAVIGAGPAVIVFFAAPFFGILVGIYLLITRSKHELPYGPYLALATAGVMGGFGYVCRYLDNISKVIDAVPMLVSSWFQ